MLPLENIRLFLFDMDGTLYLGDRVFPFTRPLLETIRAQGKDYRYMTNNSSKSRADYVRKLNSLGIPAVERDIVTSADATVLYLRANLPDLRFYVCGTASMCHEFAEGGIRVTQEADERVEGIVIGYDTELTYRKLDDLSRLLTERPDLPYIATHPDLTCPTEYGCAPDCGSFCEMIEHATGRRPLVIGKPEPLMPRMAMEAAGVSPAETLVIGDRLNTDIECGLRAGCETLLVFSGEATPAMHAAAARKPSDAVADCGVLLDRLRALA